MTHTQKNQYLTVQILTVNSQLARAILCPRSCWSLGYSRCFGFVFVKEDCSLGLSVEWDVRTARHDSHAAFSILSK
jgi:hypothetical protein